MNLENLYGSHEQLMKVFESALQENEPIEVFMRLLAIYEQSNKVEVSMTVVEIGYDVFYRLNNINTIPCLHFLIEFLIWGGVCVGWEGGRRGGEDARAQA